MKLKILFVLLVFLSLIFVVGGKNVFAQVNGNNVGPELADPPAGANVVCGKNYSGTAAVINEVTDAPHNTAICADVVLRVNVNSHNTDDQVKQYANALNQSGDFKQGTLVVFGVELNNLDKGAWDNTSETVQQAADDYAEKYIAFASVVHQGNKYKVAPAPPDLYNTVYSGTDWVDSFASAISRRCDLVDTLVADIFKVDGVQDWETKYTYEQKICGRTVTHFEGWGADPHSSIADQITFLKNQALPGGVNTGTTLIVNNCNGFGGSGIGNSTSKGWLYWIPTTPDKVYSADGSEFNYSTCTGGGEAPRPFDVSQEVPCTDTTNPEFHSLRPYPANPCDKQVQDQTLLCSNDLVVVKSTSPGSGGTCTAPAADGSYDCTYKDVDEHVNVSVDLSGAELPIMGNTKDVPNGTWVSSNTDAVNLSAAQRVNNYVSWYLNGVVNKAEEDFPVTSANPNYLVNYSGPINKLLPFAVQSVTRLASVINAVQTLANQKPANDQSARHNQIVGCPVSELLTLVPCYLFNSQVSEDRLNTFANKQFQGFWSKVFPYIPYSTTEDRVGTAGTNPPPTTPPLNNEVTFTPSTGTNYEHNLYFAHMQEDAELASKLQNTFKSTFAIN